MQPSFFTLLTCVFLLYSPKISRWHDFLMFYDRWFGIMVKESIAIVFSENGEMMYEREL